MTKKRTIIIVSDGKNGPSATQRISFEQPLSLPDSNIKIVFEKHIPKPSLVRRSIAENDASVVVLSRYSSFRGMDWIENARKCGIPTIYHIDDDLLSVPESLGKEKFEAYNKPERISALRNNMEACDLLYTSTTHLAERFRYLNIDNKIFAGDIYCSTTPEDVGALIPLSDGPVFGYMGTGGHSRDLAMILPTICSLLDKFPMLQFELFGTIDMPNELIRFGRRVRHIPPVSNYNEFTQYLRSLGWWVGLAPLEDNPFNRCKADTKWVEYTIAGFATIASNLPVYHRACAGGTGILATTQDDWFNSIQSLLFDPISRQRMVEQAQRKARIDYTHEKLRDQILSVFDQARSNMQKRSF